MNVQADKAMPNKVLSVNNLCVDYVAPAGLVRAVNNVSLDIAAGETLGLAGESGCGKSTLALALLRLHRPPALVTEGTIHFAGKDILAMSQNELQALRWNDISIVFQSAMNSLNPVISVGEQIIDVIRTHTNMSVKEANDRAVEMLKLVGIHADRLKSFPHQLSGGMRQRVVIAIALVLEPKLIVMDEPTTALDVVVEREIMDELQELKNRFGFSILFISHDLSLMGEISDRIGIMYAGKLVEMAETKQLIHNPSHPYTEGLLGSFPQIGDSNTRLQGIPGNPLNLLDAPNGCYFQSRCRYVKEDCREISPEMTVTESGGQVACLHTLNNKSKVKGGRK